MESISLKKIHQDLINMQKDIRFIKFAIAEDFELSKEVKKQLTQARKTPRSKYISQSNIEKEFLR